MSDVLVMTKILLILLWLFVVYIIWSRKNKPNNRKDFDQYLEKRRKPNNLHGFKR